MEDAVRKGGIGAPASPSAPPTFADWPEQRRGRHPAFHHRKEIHGKISFGIAPAPAYRKSALRPLAVRLILVCGGIKPYRIVPVVAIHSRGNWELFRYKETGQFGARMKPPRGRAGLRPNCPLFLCEEERNVCHNHEERPCGVDSRLRPHASRIAGRRRSRRRRPAACMPDPQTPDRPAPHFEQRRTRRE